MGKRIKKECKPIKQEPLYEPNEYMDVDNTDVHIKKEKEEPSYIEEPLNPYRYPIVCTTRLENMCIMQLYLRRRKPKNIIKKIYNESKSAYNHLRLGYNISCTCKKRIHEISIAKLHQKLSFLSSNSKVLKHEEEDSEVEQASVDISSDDDDDEVLASTVKKKKEEAASILRDALMKDENVEAIDEVGDPAESTSEVCTNILTLIKDLTVSLDLKIIDVMGVHTNVIIIIKNVYSHTTEVYVTDANNTIFEFVTVPNNDYSLIYKIFNVSNCSKNPVESLNSKFSNCLMWITCCCWYKRKKEFKARFSKEFAKFLTIPHECTLKCSCCCNEVKESTVAKDPILIANKLDMDSQSKHEVESKTSSIKKIKSGIKNYIIQSALHFNKPKKFQPIHKMQSKNDLTQLSHINSLHFKCTHISKKTNRNFTENYEFAGVGEKGELIFHDFNMEALCKIDKISVKFKDSSRNACCNYTLNRALTELGAIYDLNPIIINYIDGIHKSIIFRDLMVQKCVICKPNNTMEIDSLKYSKTIYCKRVEEPIEHIKKAIVGQIVVPKVHLLEQTKYMEDLSKTIQEMMVKLEGKFPNISFFINETGLPVASLPKPYNCYPIEDLTILSQVLQFAQHKITGQVPAVMYVPIKDKETSTTGEFIQLNSVSGETSSEKPNEEPLTMETASTESYDICSIMIKCNKVAYNKSFESFIRNSGTNEEVVMPTILNVCSLRENHEIARQLNEIVNDENTTITILDDD